MDVLGVIFVIVLIIIAIVAGLLFWRHYIKQKVEKERAEKARDYLKASRDADAYMGPSDLSPNSDLTRMQPGDWLSYLDLPGNKRMVKGVIECTVDSTGYVWYEVHLEDNAWISVEPGSNAEVTEWRMIPAGDVQGFAIGVMDVRYQDTTYSRNEAGYGSFTARGNTDTPTRGRVEFAEFKTSDGEKYLSFERFALDDDSLDQVEFAVTQGEKLEHTLLTLYPGGNEGSEIADELK